MPDESGPPRARFGIGPWKKRYHFFTVDEPSDGRPTRLRAACGFGHLGGPESLLGFEPVESKDAPLIVGEGWALCAQCVENVGRTRRAGADETKKRRDRIEDGLAQVITLLNSVRVMRGDPTIYEMRFGGQPYMVKAQDIYDVKRFCAWWFSTFNRPLLLDEESWHEVLDRTGRLADIALEEDNEQAEEASEETLVTEVVLSVLGGLSVAEQPALVSIEAQTCAFRHRDKTWVLTKDVMKALTREGYKLKPVEVARLMRKQGIFVDQSECVRVRSQVMRAWPVDPKRLADEGKVTIYAEPNGGEKDVRQKQIEGGRSGDN